MYFQQRDVQHWGCPNVPQNGGIRDGCGFQKTWKCSGPAEAFPMVHLCPLITCKALGFYDLQAVRWMFDSGKPTENLSAKKIRIGDTCQK